MLKDFLGDFVSAYLDDVLIYTNGDLTDHWIKVNMVLKALGLAGLKLDPKKSEFAVKQTKYLGFIICLGEGIKVDPEKKSRGNSQQESTNLCEGGPQFYWVCKLLSRLHRWRDHLRKAISQCVSKPKNPSLSGTRGVAN